MWVNIVKSKNGQEILNNNNNNIDSSKANNINNTAW